MPEFKDALSPVQLVTQEKTPSAAPLIAQTAATLLNIGAVVKDKVDLSGFRKDVAEGQEVLAGAQVDVDNLSRPLDNEASAGLKDLETSMATHVRAVEQGVRTRDQAAVAINSMFRTFIAEHPHLATEARQVVSSTGGTSSLGGSIGASTTGMSLEEKNAREQAVAVRNIQQTWGVPLEQAGNIYAQLQQAGVRASLEPVNATEFTTTNNTKLFASVSNINSAIMNDVKAAGASGDIAQLSVVKNRGLATSAQSRLAAKANVNASAQQMIRSGNFISQSTIDSQLANVDATYDDLDILLNSDLLDSAKILQDRASFVGTVGLNKYNDLFMLQSNLAEQRGALRLSTRAATFLAPSPEAMNRHLAAFAAAKNTLDKMQKGETLRDALADLNIAAEERSEIERAASFLMEAGDTDIWSFLMSNSQTKAANPTPAAATTTDDINAATTHTALAPAGAQTQLAIPHTLNSVANPQKYILSGSFFDMYTTALEADQGEAMLNMADNFTASALANISGADKLISGQGLPTSTLVVNPQVISDGELLVPRPIKPTKNVSIPAIPFIRRDIDPSTLNPALAVAGGRSSLRLQGISGAAQLLDDNITRINYLLTFTMAQYGPESKEFKDLLNRVTSTVRLKKEEE